MGRSTETLLLLLLCCGAATAARAQEEPPEAVKRAIERAAEDPSERQRDADEAAAAARRAATVTPIAAGGGIVVVASGTLALTPGVAGRQPFNCLHWSFCRKDAWSQPMASGSGLGPPITLEELLTREGFSTTPVDCGAAGGHVIMLIWHVPAGDPPLPPTSSPVDRHWVHAMKRLDGKWSSKNGPDGLYRDIPDTDAFLDTHYPPKPGKKRVVRCFAKS
jgi:hypothetical protein